MKFFLTVQPVACVLILFVLTGCGSNRIAVKNSGAEVVRVRVEGSVTRHMLGPSGTGYYDPDTRIQIGDAVIKYGRRVEIKNTGSSVIKIVYNNIIWTEKTMQIGEGGTGYLSRSTPFKIGDVSVSIAPVRMR